MNSCTRCLLNTEIPDVIVDEKGIGSVCVLLSYAGFMTLVPLNESESGGAFKRNQVAEWPGIRTLRRLKTICRNRAS